MAPPPSGARRWVGLGGALLLLAFAGLNVLAFRHSYLMTHFSPGRNPGPSIERLGASRKLGFLILGASKPRPANARTPRDFGMSFETHAFKGAFDTPLEAWLVRRPRGKGLVVMFPGYAAGKDCLLPAAKAFFRLGYESLLVDFHGSGGSGGSTTSIGFHEASDVAAAFGYAEGALGARAPVLYGVSMGAAAALRAVHVHGLRPKALIVEAPFDRMLTTIRNRFVLMGVPSAPAAQLLLYWGGVQGGFDAFSHNPVEYARSVRSPTLLLAGESDPYVSLGESRAVFDALQGPKDFTAFPGVAHQVFVEARPGEWAASVGGFLAELEDARR
ncbi:MAG: alpha/beta hydrolase [Elusimicrobia bacterium]|nr:alpha/beta hydrolase [Elusimicrobiota bacterium]